MLPQKKKNPRIFESKQVGISRTNDREPDLSAIKVSYLITPIIIKVVWYRHRKRSMEQTESQGIDSNTKELMI